MKEHPILFSAPMVRALLEGTKTQTRRLVKPQPEHAQIHTWKGETLYDGEARVWCWRDNVWPDASVDCNGRDDVSALLLPFARWEVGDRLWVWASRITLEITDVRVERVQAISDADIAAEGATAESVIDLFFDKRPVGVSMPLAGPQRPIDAWSIGWSTINGPESWAANPWVWVLGFRRVEA